MKIKVVMTDTRVKHRNKNDVGLAYKRQTGIHSATLSQSIEIEVPTKINHKWKRNVTHLLTKYQHNLKKNERPMVFIGDTGIKPGKRVVSFSFRNIHHFVNCVANYILTMRREGSDKDNYTSALDKPELVMASVLKLKDKFKRK